MHAPAWIVSSLSTGDFFRLRRLLVFSKEKYRNPITTLGIDQDQMHKTTEELEAQNATRVSNHPDSMLAALFSMWKKLERRPETICMLTVAAFLNLEDYDTYEWKELSRDQAFDLLFNGDIPFVVVEFHTKGDREEGCDPQHTLLFWRDEGMQVWEVESWWCKKRPLMTLIDRSSMEINDPELSDCIVYYLTFLGRR